MADPFATEDELAAFWRPLDAEESTKAVTLLRFASAMIRTEFGDIDARIEAEKLDPDIPKFVAMAAVKQAMIAADQAGITESSEQAGSYGVTTKFANPMGNLYLTKQWKRMLRPGGSGRKAFSINPAPNAGLGYLE
ncbi:Gp19/Gp15/Gp42 family protein [Rhodococcus opacus]|uniref:Phage protein Gp19/Gp15/Gp42 n=1 Tax=Rhodococcus opacus TaxID=37919 RepID=A0A2S8JAY7_RHOOP|nr:Gp19/Gp15/Gp42 family protein [Rhodococcus opacus]PQP24160.1 hypothetical protein C5613_14870 [Rhodococcus opacus]